MKKWKCIINLKPFWGADISVEEKGIMAARAIKLVAKRLPEYESETLMEIAQDFECISGDGTDGFTPTQDFDARMFDLYEFADSYDIWVATTI
jgi:hypothetical protein